MPILSDSHTWARGGGEWGVTPPPPEGSFFESPPPGDLLFTDPPLKNSELTPPRNFCKFDQKDPHFLTFFKQNWENLSHFFSKCPKMPLKLSFFYVAKFFHFWPPSHPFTPPGAKNLPPQNLGFIEPPPKRTGFYPLQRPPTRAHVWRQPREKLMTTHGHGGMGVTPSQKGHFRIPPPPGDLLKNDPPWIILDLTPSQKLWQILSENSHF